MDVLKVGEILKVTQGSSERNNAKWLETGDIVRVIGVYPHHVLVERLPPETVFPT